MAAGILLVAVLSSAADAQTRAVDAPGDARFQLGTLQLDPRFGIRNAGVDTNVFNSSRVPVRDFTITAGPELDSSFRAGRLWLEGTSAVGWTYFQRAVGQRFTEVLQTGRAELSLVGVTPHADGKFERTRRRPNEEIDLRVRQQRSMMGGGLMVHPGSRLTLDLTYEERDIDFDEDLIEGIDLSRSLDRTEREVGLSAAVELTPLTTFVVRGARRVDDFDTAQVRNSRSISVMPGLEFKPLALISGSVFVGFRSFDPDSSELPGFNGVIAAVDVHYLAHDFFRLDVNVARDIDYSFEFDSPYYVSTSFNTVITQAIGGSWDVVGRVGLTGMAYQAFDIALAPSDGRIDRAWLRGVGVGRRIGAELRVGFDVNYVTRESSIDRRRYSGLRAGGSFTYGY